jgi:peptidoglycan/xylan/chitin deacetylase (PgdA/CDA1 family)
MSTKNPGALVLSFDFELAWGLRCGSGDRDCARGMDRVHDVVERLLDLVAKYDISCTWATVGHLMLKSRYRDWERIRGFAPRYDWFTGRWCDGIPSHDSDEAAAYYAPELVEKIVRCPVYQELACHTFSHIDVGSSACGTDLVREELNVCGRLARQYGRELRSVVFPRNSIGHLDVVEEAGFRCYRGRDSEWYWFAQPTHLRSFARTRFLLKPIPIAMRLGRYVSEKTRHVPPVRPARRVGRLWEIPHSMFFPGVYGVSRLVSMKDRWRRAIRGLERAAAQGGIMSIYTHPHNFRNATEDMLSAYERICRRAAELRRSGCLRILPMEHIAEELDHGKNVHWTR